MLGSDKWEKRKERRRYLKEKTIIKIGQGVQSNDELFWDDLGGLIILNLNIFSKVKS